MHSSNGFIISAMLLFTGGSAAEAADPRPYQYVVETTGASPTCSPPKNQAGQPEQPGEQVPADKDLLLVEVKLPQGFKIQEALLEKPDRKEVKPYQVSAAAGANPVVKFTRKDFGAATSEDKAQLKLKVSPVAGSPVQEVACADPIAYFASKEGTNADTGGPEVALDGEALKAWLEGAQGLRKRLLDAQAALGVKGEPRYLVHLPSGKLAYPAENGVSEAQPLQVAFLLPKDEKRLPGMRLVSCPSVDPFRTKISKVEDDKKQNATVREEKEEKAQQPEFELVPIGQMLRCGEGKLSYSVEPIPAYVDQGKKQADKADGADDKNDVAPSPNDFEFRVRPRYHLAATAMLGYDTATTTKFEKQTVRDEAGAESQVIGEVKDRQGLAVYVGAVWMIGGVDYEDMQPWNYFANLFVGVKPTSPTEDVVAGLAITPTGSVSLALGLSLHKTQRLKSGFTVGSTFTGEGDIPVESTWKGVKPGFFAGLSIDSNIYDQLLDRF